MQKFQNLIADRDALLSFINHNSRDSSSDIIITQTFKMFEKCLKSFLLTLKLLCQERDPKNPQIENESYSSIINLAYKNQIITDRIPIIDLIQFHTNSKNSFLSIMPYKKMIDQSLVLIREVDYLINAPLQSY